MAVKIRLRMQGKKDRAFYRIVVADSRLPRDGKYLEKLGWYNPFDEKNQAELNAERLGHWLSVGAELTPKAKSIAKKYHPNVLSQFLAKKPKAKKVKADKPKAEAAPKKAAAPKKKAAKKAAPKKKAADKAAE